MARFLPLRDLIASHEAWLVARVLAYSLETNYTKYTSTLEEAWRASIAGLSAPLMAALEAADCPPSLGPDDDYTADPVASFGILEAKRHRDRGVTLELFLGLMKYYRQSYLDLVEEGGFDAGYGRDCRFFVDRFFDRVELGFITEWVGASEARAMGDLQAANRWMTNEKNRYLTVFESQFAPTMLVGPDGAVENVNRAAFELLCEGGVPGSVYYGGANVETIAPWLAAGIAGLDRQARHHFETELATRSGLHSFDVQVTPMLDVSGKFAGSVVTLNETTARKRAEANQRMAALGQLAAGVAHEFNNLLAAVRLRAELAARRHTGVEYEALCLTALKVADRGSRVCDSLIAFARPHHHLRERVAIDEPLDEALALLSQELQGGDIRVDRDLDTGPWGVLGDRQQLQDAFVHIILNARQSMLSGGTLCLRARASVASDGTATISLSVADRGCGIEADYLPYIFDPFFTTKGVLGDGDVPCTGLGLSVAQGIVTAHGGTIGVESTAGRGTTVDMRFPAVELGEVSETSPAATQQPSASETEAVRPMEPRRVLVADDDDELRELLGETLTGAGYVVTTVESATKAVEALQTGEFDVVLSDVKMPGGGGQAVVGAALELAQAPPVLLITGWTDGNLQQELLSLGARACLPKPISVRDLLAAVSDCLS